MSDDITRLSITKIKKKKQ